LKTQQVIFIAFLVCSLLGTSDTAVARNDCPDGSLVGGTYDEIVIDEFVSCSILGVLVSGNVQVIIAFLSTSVSGVSRA